MTTVIEGRLTIKDDGTIVLKKFGSTAEKEMGKAGKASKKAAETSDESWTKAKGTWIAAAAAIAGVTIAFAKLTKAAKEAVIASETQRKAVAGMEAVMKSMGRYTPELTANIQAYASELQRVTNFGDEATLQGAKFLMTYGDITNKLLPRSIKTMQDLAALMGGGPAGLVRAANMLGKASMGMTGELRRVGITVDQATFESEGYLGVLKQIEKQVSGQAEAMADPWTQMSNAIGDAKENAGAIINLGFAPWAEDITALLGNVTETWKSLAEKIQEVRRVELQYQADALKAQLERGTYTADMGGLGADFSIDEEVTPEQRELLKRKLENLNAALAVIAGEISGEGTTNGDRAKLVFDIGPSSERVSAETAGLEDESAFQMGMSEQWAAELEAMREHEAEKLAIRTEAAEAWLETYTDLSGAEGDLTEAETQRIDRIIAESQEARKKMVLNTLQSQLSATSQNLQMIAQEMGKHGKAAFRAYQATAIAETIISTYKAAQGAYAALAPIPIVGPALGVAAAAAATVAGIARVHAIAKQSPGGGSVGSTTSGGAIPVGTRPGETTLPEIPATGDDQRGQTTIIFEGDVLADEFYIEMLAEKLSGMVEDRDVRLVASDAREY